MNWTVPIVLAVAGVIGIYVGIAGKLELGGRIMINLQRWSRFGCLLSGVVFLGIALFLGARTTNGQDGPDVKPSIVNPEPAKSTFPFEAGVMGWLAQDYEDSRACSRVSQSEENAKTGRYCLRLDFDLRGGDAQRSKGEAWVVMSDNPPAGKSIPLDLTNRTVTAWVFAPSAARGDRSKPNGFQIFVKDKNWKSEYGRWHNVVGGQWVQISLAVSISQPMGGYMDVGFDPSQIVAVGVKFGAGGGSTQNYQGPVFLDDVDF